LGGIKSIFEGTVEGYFTYFRNIIHLLEEVKFVATKETKIQKTTHTHTHQTNERKK
jgi:hypothetical protein